MIRMQRASATAAMVFASSFISASGVWHEQESVDTVGAAEISYAVSVGLTREVEPYLLRQSADGRTVVGALYTPHVRIARYVRAIADAGGRVAADELPEHLMKPVVYVAMQSPSERNGYGSPELVAILRPPGAEPAGRSTYFMPPPNRTVSAGQRLDRLIATHLLGEIPVDNVEVFGAFPLAVARRTMVEFCTYRVKTAPEAYSVVAGFVSGPVR